MEQFYRSFHPLLVISTHKHNFVACKNARYAVRRNKNEFLMYISAIHSSVQLNEGNNCWQATKSEPQMKRNPLMTISKKNMYISDEDVEKVHVIILISTSTIMNFP
jgi:hypothetical protein